ncbi:MAG: hypothetical protein CM1200mP41_25900 [Gammaproteobacteria bacterium]|nr:MAG: hypothetical protein CM1200mP41_25900 [Gammaproteobacteria bacterium]
MNKQQISHFDAILKSWRHELVDDLERTVSAMQDELLNLPDPNDRASQETDRSLELRTRDRERKLIRKIDESRASIASGDYGYCDNCGIEIGVQRLRSSTHGNTVHRLQKLKRIARKTGVLTRGDSAAHQLAMLRARLAFRNPLMRSMQC